MLQVRSRNDISDCISSLKMIDYYVSMFVSRMIEKIWLWKALARIKAPRAATMIELVQIFSFSSCLMHNLISGSSKQSKFRKIHSYRNGEGLMDGVIREHCQKCVTKFLAWLGWRIDEIISLFLSFADVAQKCELCAMICAQEATLKLASKGSLRQERCRLYHCYGNQGRTSKDGRKLTFHVAPNNLLLL